MICCTFCMESEKRTFSANESFLDKNISELISVTAGVEVSLVTEAIVCTNCALSLYQANAIIAKVRQVFAKTPNGVVPQEHNAPNTKKRKNNALSPTKISNDDSLPLSVKKTAPKATTLPRKKKPIEISKSLSLLDKKTINKISSPKNKSVIISKNSNLLLHTPKSKSPGHECPNCGSMFRSQQIFDKHYFSEKCSTSVFSCQEPSCKKRFSKLSIMRHHMSKCHPLSIYNTS